MVKQSVLHWKISVPIFKNSVILGQLAIAIGVPFGIVGLFIGIVSNGSVYTLYAFALILALFLLTWLFIMALYGGRYMAEFILDDKGVCCKTQEKQAKTNRLLNSITVVLGVLSGKPAVAGAGMLAQARQETRLPWSRIRKASFRPASHTILLQGGCTEKIAVFCTKKNYDQVAGFVLGKIRTVA
ncbi:hypothetical protein SDC9_191194 [bioreactor metagenome]|uniref:Uncharacterized protein n=1 Tax=bioreactor metagenome TaxID=1076179 RepID=A0A645I5D9_9ZZZZ|nr:hypothetical protein [Candidatus Pelethousia sp.]